MSSFFCTKKSNQYHLTLASIIVFLIFATELHAQCPTVNAGPDDDICANQTYQLNGSVTNAARYFWTHNGGGTLDFSNVLNPTYTPAGSDLDGISITFTLTATNPTDPSCTDIYDDDVILTVVAAPVADAGPDATICEGDSYVISGSSANNYSSVQWEPVLPTSGLFNNELLLHPTFTPSASDILRGYADVRLFAYGNTPCGNTSGDIMRINIVEAPSVNAGADISSCGTSVVNIAGASATNASAYLWTSSGSGSFSDASLLNTTYTPTAADVANGSVLLTLTVTGDASCASVSDSRVLTLSTGAVVYAGIDAQTCYTSSYTIPAGQATATSYSSLVWSHNGNGSLSGSSSLTPTYTPVAADAGNIVQLTLTATSSAPCSNQVSDLMNLTILELPTADAGLDINACATDATIDLAGAATNQSSVLWTTTNGTGSILNPTTLTPTYLVDASDITRGFVTMVLTANGMGNCSSASDVMVIYLQASPTANAGPDFSGCAASNFTITSASATHYSSILWEVVLGSGTILIGTETTLSPVYQSVLADAGTTVRLRLTAQPQNGCLLEATDYIDITIGTSPDVSFDVPSTETCGNSGFSLASVNPEATHYSSLAWTTSGTGTFTDAGILEPVYTPSAADLTAGMVTLTLTAAPQSPCTNSASAHLDLNIYRNPTANAGSDQTICENTSITLNGSASNYDYILWTTSGDGTYTAAGTTSPTYFPGPTDIATGVVNLTITAYPVSPCATNASDVMQLNIQPAPEADAGADLEMCDGDLLAITGFAANYSTFTWSSTGNGTFTPTNSLTPNFTPSASEIANGSTIITLTVTGVSPCATPTADQATVTIFSSPTANAGTGGTICQTGVLLSATATNYANLLWTTSGDGTFSDNTVEDPYYTPGPSDIGNSVMLTLTAFPNSPCTGNAISQVIYDIEPAPQAVAFPGGADAICETASSYALSSATAPNATSYAWTSSGDGTFSNTTILNPVYYPGTSDVNNGFVDLTLTAYNLPCNAANSTMRLTITNEPTADAGANKTICIGDQVPLSDATASNYSSVAWTIVSGSGTFSDASIVNPIYYPSAADYASASVRLRLTANADAPCAGLATSDVIIYITQEPTVDVGTTTEEICEDQTFTITTATASNESSLQWSSSGDGTWINATSLVATYTPGSNDIILGSVILRLTAEPLSPCVNPAFDEFTLNVQANPTANAGSDREICEGEQLNITNSTATHYSSLLWSTTGSGSFDDATLLRPIYTPSVADVAAGSVSLTLTANSTSPCSGFVVDNMILTISPDPQVNAGTDAVVCGNGNYYHLADATASDYASLVWTTTGDGVFDDASNNLNATYTPGISDIAIGSVTLTLTAIVTSPCYVTIHDDVILTIEPMPIANAGPDASVCGNSVYALSSATATDASAYLWTTNGTGSFNNNALLNPSYTPSAADVSSGSVVLTLTATGTNSCNGDNDTDTMTLSFIPSPTANAGPDETICENGITISNATAVNFNQVLWTSSGTSGTILNANTLTPTYTPSAADISAGTVTLTLTATANNPCTTSATDQIIFTILENPTANAGADDEICENETYTLSGSVNHEVSYTWSTSGDGSFLNSNTTNPTYIPGNNDIANGTVTITLNAAATAPCASDASDQMVLTIDKLPIVDAGPNATLCSGSTHTTTGSSISNSYVSLVWTSSGTGTFNNPNLLNTIYTPSAADLLNGFVSLTLTATSSTVCGSSLVSDFLTITFVEEATANAGTSPTICSSASYTVSDATASGNASILWTTSGDGSLVNENSLTPSYFPGPADIANGSATLTLTVSSSAPCTGTATSSMVITILPSPSANAGADGSVCEGGSYNLNGTAQNANSFIWSTNGTGSFTNGGTLTPTYTPDAGDVAAGQVIITLTALSGAPCNESVSDQMILTIEALPDVYAGTDATVCEGSAYAITSSTATNYASVLWSTSGTGTFVNQAAVQTSYTPSAADILAGSVTLTLTANSNAPCSSNPSDSFVLTITGAALADAGIDATTCYSSSYNVTTASAENYSAINWTHNGSGTLINAGTISPTYTPTAADAALGQITLTMNVTGYSPCGNDVDQMVLTVVGAPQVNAGPDAQTCENQNYLISNSSGSNYSAITWTTSGTGVFSNAAILQPEYFPSSADILSGNVVLTVSVEGITPCSGTETDSFILSFVDAPTANAGNDISICSGSSVNITTATATNATAYLWTSSGTGVFTGSNTLSPMYTPSANDINIGSVLLSLRVSGASNCDDATDNMTVTIEQSATADAGSDGEVCAGDNFTVSTATASNYTSLQWQSSGTGSFINANQLTPTYTPSATDIANGFVTLTLTANSNAPCLNPAVSDMLLTIYPSATADAGSDATVCQPGSFTVSDASASSYSSLQWTSSGTGSFINNGTLNPTYTPSGADYNLGAVTLTLRANSQSPCNTTATSAMILTLQTSPVANAGSDAIICEGNSYTITSATASHYSNLYWTTSGTGTLSNSSTLSPSYLPSTADIAAGSVVLTLHLEGSAPCNLEDSDEMIITIQSLPEVFAGADANLCDGSSYTIPDANISNSSSFIWSSNGSGTFLNPNTISPTYVPSAADFANGSVIITLQAASSAPCSGFVADALTLTLYEAVTADAGSDANICESGSYHITSATASNYNSILWTTNGNGSFDNAGTLNPVYTPGLTDISNGSVVLTLSVTGFAPCDIDVSDQMTLTINDEATANAGENVTVCAGSYTVTDATATNYSLISWSSSGTGTFTNVNSLTPTYTPSAADLTNGSVTLTLTVTGVSPCSNITTDTKLVSFSAGATANAGPNETICEGTNFTVQSAGATAYASLLWSTNGDGTFVDGTTLFPTYQPGSNDIANGSVTLTLTATSTPPCSAPVSDQMVLTITPLPVVNAGNDQNSCSTSSFAITGATALHYTSLSWSSTGTGTFSNPNALNPTYYPTTTDITAGSVILTLTATSNAGCSNGSDSFLLTFGTSATANAGPNASICQSEDFQVTGASASNASSIQWTTSGTGSFFNGTTTSPIYYPSTQDINNGGVILTMTVQAAPPCSTPSSDQMTLTIQRSPTANAGSDISACSTNSVTITGASSANASSINWTSTGTGTLSNGNTLTPTYHPSAADITNGSVMLTLTANASAPCVVAAQDQMMISFTNAPTANAGPDQSVCSGGNIFLGSATATNYSSLLWQTNGTGYFLNAAVLNATYVPSAADVSSGSVILSLNVQPQASCSGLGTISDFMQVSFTTGVTVYAGQNGLICDGGSYTISDAQAGAYSSLIWSTSGTGFFNNATILNPTYTPSGTDILNGSVTLTLTVQGAGSCAGTSGSDNMVLTILEPAAVQGGPDLESCGTNPISLTNVTAQNYFTVSWSTSGDGTFSNQSVLNAIYTPGTNDVLNGNVQLTVNVTSIPPCSGTASEAITIQINEPPTAFAGNDAAVCGNQSYTISDALASQYSSVSWTTSGTGTFNNQASLNPIYTPSTADNTAGSVILTLTAEGNSGCENVTDVDNMTLTILPGPTADAGIDQHLCDANAYQILGASATFYSTLQWTTSGTGSFVDNTQTNPVYTPSAADFASGSVTLTLTANPLAPCTASSVDELVLTFSNPPTAFAGADATVATGSSYSLFDASATDYNSLLWSTSGDGSFDNQTSLNPVYTPGANDISSGSVTLSLTAENGINCPQTSDDMVLLIEPNPTAFAGVDAEICETNTYQLSDATASNFASLTWSTSGDGSFDNQTILNPSYTPGANDISNGAVTLTLTATCNWGCPSASDQMILTIHSLPIAFAGTNIATCVSNAVEITNATATNAGAFSWTHNGAGSLSSTSIINPIYTPAPADEGNTVTLTLTVNGIDGCSTYADVSTVEIIVDPAPQVFAGINGSTCVLSDIQLSSATLNNAINPSWTHNGNGTLNNPNIINPIYTPNITDAGNTVIFTLSAQGIGNCSAQSMSSQVSVVIAPSPTAFAGTDKSTCSTNPVVINDASFTNGASILWSHNGNGSISNSTVINPTYTPVAADEGNTVTLTLTVNGAGTCAGQTAVSTVNIDVEPDVFVFAGTNTSTCANGSVQITDASVNFSGSFIWTENGAGSLDNNSIINPTYTPAAADAGNIVTLTLTGTGTGSCSSSNATSSVQINVIPTPMANAGNNQSSCDINPYLILSASASNYSSLAWTSSGTGSFDNTTILQPTYTPSASDVLNGSVLITLTAVAIPPCTNNAVSSFTLSLSENMTVQAGPDAIICEGETHLLSAATVDNQTSVLWTSSGSGTFSDAASVNPTYLPSPSDYLNGSAVLTITASNATCPDISDAMTLSFQGLPAVNAGQNDIVCESGSYELINALATNYSSLQWSGGDGVFDYANALNPIYTPGPNDIASGNVTLSLVAFATAPCSGQAVDAMVLQIQNDPTAYAGANVNLCNGANYLITDASASNYSSLSWTTSGTGNFINNGTLNPTYIASAFDISTGSVFLTLTANGISPCNGQATSQMQIIYVDGPLADAGANTTICETEFYINTDASASNFANLLWTSSGDGSFSDAAVLNSTYFPGTNDIAAGAVTLTLTAYSTGLCPDFTDNVTVIISSGPIVDAGSSTSMCVGFNPLLGATASNYSSILWTTTGSGTITGATSLNPVYQATLADAANSPITFTLTAQPLASCAALAPVSSTIVVDVLDAITVDAGPNATICQTDTYTINGASATNATSLLWTTSGTGTISDPTIINPTYIPSLADINLGFVTLTLNASNPSCNNVIDNMVLTINKFPAVNAGADVNVCVLGSYTVQDASVSNSFTSFQWTTNGIGTLTNTTTLTPTYLPDPTEIGTQVTLTLTATAAAPCTGNFTDSKALFIIDTPIANAGPDALICETDTYTTSGASVANASSSVWTTSGSGLFVNPGSAQTTYLPSAADIAAGSVTLTLEALNPPCASDADQLILSFNTLPVVNAGFDATVDINTSFTVTTASVSNYQSFVWSTSGTGTFDDPTLLGTTYTPSAQDFAWGSLQLILTATGIAPCDAETVSDYMILTVTDHPAADFYWDLACQGSPVQFFIDQTVTDITNIVSYSWNFGDGTTSTLMEPSHAYAASGFYQVTLIVVDVNGYSNTVQKTIEINQLPVALFSWESPSCNGTEMAFFDNSSTNSGYITEWVWDFGDGNTETITFPDNPDITHLYLLDGLYDVTLSITTSDGCVAAAINTIQIVPAPVAAFDFTASCAENNAQFNDLSQTNGSGTIVSWSWNFGDPLSGVNNFSNEQNPVHQFTSAGTYDVQLIIMSSSGCSDTVVNQIDINDAPVVDILVASNFVCLAEPVQFSAQAANAVSWQWNFGDGNTSSQGNPVHTYQFPGVYTVTLSIMDANGCVGNATETITVNDLPTANFTNTAPGCPDESIYFTDLSSSPNGAIANWFWDFGDGNTVSIDAPNSPNVSHIYALPGTYNVTLTVTDATGCTDDFTRQIVTENGPLANFTFTQTCFGQPVLFTDLSSPNGGSDLFSWAWDFGDPLSGINNSSTLQNPSHNFTAPGTYTVSLTVTNTQGCTNTFTADVVIAETVDIDFTSSGAAFCPGEVIQFTSTGIDIVSYNWEFGDGGTSIQQNPTYVYPTAGTYTVSLTVTGIDGCQGFVEHDVVINEEPVAAFSTDSPSCFGAPMSFFNASTSPTGFINEWIWNFGDGTADVIVTFPNNPDVTHLYTLEGTYNASLTVTNSNGCSSTIIHEVIVAPAPVAAFSFTGTCAESPVEFTDLSQENGGGLITSWDWNFGDPASGVNNTSNLQDPVHSFTAPGTYDVTLIIGNVNGCTDTVTNQVDVAEALLVEIQADNDTLCLGAPVTFQGIAAGAVIWNWDFGDGSTSTLQNPTHTYTSIGNYTVTLFAETADGCSNTAEFDVIVLPNPVSLFVTTAPVCSNDSVYFTNQSTTQNGFIASWIWDLGDGNVITINDPGDPNIAYLYANPGTYEVMLTVIDNVGCEHTSSRLVQIEPSPIADFSYDAGCFGIPVLFTDLTSPNNGSDLFAWQWYFGDPNSGINNSSTLQNPSHLFTDIGPFDVTLIVTNTMGCTDTIVKTLEITELPTVDFTVDDDSICLGTPQQFTGIGNNINTWFWQFGDGGTSIQQNPSYLYAEPGQYDVALTVTSISQCQNSITKPVFVNDAPIANFATENGCLGDTTAFTDLTVSPNGLIVSWLWDFGDPASGINNTSTLQNPTHYFATADDYFVTLTVTDNFDCEQTISRWVSIYERPQAAFSFNQVCEPNGQVFFFNESEPSGNGSPILNYEWHFHDGYFSNEINANHIFPETDTCYIVSLTISDGFGCESTAQDTVCIWEPLSVDFTSTSVCVGNATFFDADYLPANDSIVSYAWNFNDGSNIFLTYRDTTSHTFPVAGNYFVELTATNLNGCTSTIYHEVIVYGLPLPDFSYVPGLCETPASFTDLSDGNGALVSDWYWDFGDPASGIDNNSVLQNPTHLYNAQEGSYMVKLIVTNFNGCTDSITKEITQEPCLQAFFDVPPVILCADSTICFTDNSTLTASAGQITHWSWNFGDNTLPLEYTTPQNPVCHTFSGVEGGEFLVSLTIEADVNGTMFTDTYEEIVTIRPKPTARFIPENACLNVEALFFDNSLGNGLPITEWQWDFGDLTTVNDTSTAQNSHYQYPDYGSYDVQLVVMNDYGCSDTLVSPIEIYQPPTANFIAVDSCVTYYTYFNDLSVEGGAAITDWYWHFGDPTAADSSSTNPDTQHIYHDVGDFWTELVVTDANQCTDTSRQMVTIYPIPDARFVYEDRYDGRQGQVYFQSITDGAFSFFWDFDSGDISTEEDPIYQYENNGVYNVMFVAYNQFMCPDTAYQEYEIIFTGLYFANTFVPESADTAINRFTGKGENLESYTLEVYTSWGQLIWTSSELIDGRPAESWDGTFNEQDLPSGSYIWKARATFKDGTIWEGSDNGDGNTKTYGIINLIR